MFWPDDKAVATEMLIPEKLPSTFFPVFAFSVKMFKCFSFRYFALYL